MEKQTGRGVVCVEEVRGRLGRLPGEGGLQTDTKEAPALTNSRGSGRRQLKQKKGENKQLPLCLLQAKVRRAQNVTQV